MADNDKLTATFKGDGSYESSWLVVHADSVQELNNALDAISGDLLAKVHSVGEQYKAAQAAAKGGIVPTPVAPVPHPVDNVTPQAAPDPVQQAPAAPQPQARPGVPQKGDQHPEGKRCELDGTVLTLKAGVGQYGPWANWSCPQSRKGDSHPKPEWLDKQFAKLVVGE